MPYSYRAKILPARRGGNPNLANFYSTEASINVHKVALYIDICTDKRSYTMRKIDSKHIAFHILVALYFIWVVVFGVLMGMALVNAYGPHDIALTILFTKWIFMNLVMGSALYIVIRMFRNRTFLDKMVFWSFIFMAIASIVVVVLMESLK